jgi:hypothetical protein
MGIEARRTGMPVTYEWCIETIDRESGDLIETYHAAKLKELPQLVQTETELQRLVLIRDSGGDDYAITERAWAYVYDNELPEWFSEAFDEDGDAVMPQVKVPARFHKEIAAK